MIQIINVPSIEVIQFRLTDNQFQFKHQSQNTIFCNDSLKYTVSNMSTQNLDDFNSKKYTENISNFQTEDTDIYQNVKKNGKEPRNKQIKQNFIFSDRRFVVLKNDQIKDAKIKIKQRRYSLAVKGQKNQEEEKNKTPFRCLLKQMLIKHASKQLNLNEKNLKKRKNSIFRQKIDRIYDENFSILADSFSIKKISLFEDEHRSKVHMKKIIQNRRIEAHVSDTNQVLGRKLHGKDI